MAVLLMSRRSRGDPGHVLLWLAQHSQEWLCYWRASGAEALSETPCCGWRSTARNGCATDEPAESRRSRARLAVASAAQPGMAVLLASQRSRGALGDALLWLAQHSQEWLCYWRAGGVEAIPGTSCCGWRSTARNGCATDGVSTKSCGPCRAKLQRRLS